MASVVQTLYSKKLITPAKWLESNIHHETVMGSEAYGVAGAGSDLDIYGFAIPPLDDIFPHLGGEIPGFGQQKQRFEQYQEHHVRDSNMEYDLTVYSIVKYFQLCMENNPNMVDSLFTPLDCVRHITTVGRMVRENRRLFLHKGSFHEFRGYAYSQINKMHNGRQGKQQQMVKEYGMDLKFAYHTVRLALECEQILETGDLDLRRDKELYRAIRNGEWTEVQIRQWFSEKERHLESLYESSKLPHRPDERKIRALLLNCLEEHYGRVRISEARSVAAIAAEASLLGELKALVAKYN